MLVAAVGFVAPAALDAVPFGPATPCPALAGASVAVALVAAVAFPPEPSCSSKLRRSDANGSAVTPVTALVPCVVAEAVVVEAVGAKAGEFVAVPADPAVAAADAAPADCAALWLASHCSSARRDDEAELTCIRDSLEQ